MGKKISQPYLDKIEKQLKDFGKKIDEMNDKVKSDAKAKYNETRDSLLNQMDDAFKKININIETQISEFEAKINKLKGDAKVEAQKEYDEILKNLKPRIDEFKDVINELKRQGNGAFEDIKTGALNAWNEMKTAFKKAADKFK